MAAPLGRSRGSWAFIGTRSASICGMRPGQNQPREVTSGSEGADRTKTSQSDPRVFRGVFMAKPATSDPRVRGYREERLRAVAASDRGGALSGPFGEAHSSGSGGRAGVHRQLPVGQTLRPAVDREQRPAGPAVGVRPWRGDASGLRPRRLGASRTTAGAGRTCFAAS